MQETCRPRYSQSISKAQLLVHLPEKERKLTQGKKIYDDDGNFKV